MSALLWVGYVIGVLVTARAVTPRVIGWVGLRDDEGAWGWGLVGFCLVVISVLWPVVLPVVLLAMWATAGERAKRRSR